MPLIAQNKLTIEPLFDDHGKPKANSEGLQIYRIFGWVGGKKIRKQSTDLPSLELLKKTKEDSAKAERERLTKSIAVHQTWLSADQLRDAESAYRRLAYGRTLFECVEAAEAILGTGEPVECEKSVVAWKLQMTARKLSDKTINDNTRTARGFTGFAGIKFLHETTPKLIEKYVRRPSVAPYTQLGIAARLHAWFEFTKAEKWLKRSPVEIDIGELRDRARPQEEPSILSPKQAEALLVAAAAAQKASVVFYIIAGLWCFMRRSEVLRLKKENIIIRRPEGKPAEIKIHVRGEKIGSKWRDMPVPTNVAPLFLESLDRGVFDDKTGVLCFSDWEWKHIRAKAGLLKLNYNAKRIDRPVIEESAWSSNVMRHTGMSYLFQETDGDIELVTRRAGNSEDVAFMHYLRHAEPDAFKQFNAITAAFPVAQSDAQDVA